MYKYPYPRPSVTADAVVFGADKSGLQILLIERGGTPFKGHWALPGGFIKMNESLDKAVRRELKEETEMDVSYLEQLYTFGDPKRDPRGRVVSVAYFGLVRPADHKIKGRSDAKKAEWFPANRLPNLAFDHRQMVDMALARLRAKVRYAPIGFELLPEEFTLTDLQNLYEAVLGREVDRRNFRKKVLEMELLTDLGKKAKTPGPPAKLYRFDRRTYERMTQHGFNFEI